MTDADFFYGVTDSETVDVGTFGLHSDDGTEQDNSLDYWPDEPEDEPEPPPDDEDL